MSDNVEVHVMTNKELINLANGEIEIFNRPSAQTSKDLINALKNSTPNAKILELVANYEICMKWKPSPESIKFLGDLKKLIKPEVSE